LQAIYFKFITFIQKLQIIGANQSIKRFSQ